jgi:hypothetical protein
MKTKTSKNCELAVQFLEMSEGSIPPVQPSYVAYPRGNVPQFYGSSEKLRKLYRGYHGLSYCVLTLILAAITIMGGAVLMGSKGSEVIGAIVMILGIGLYIFAIVLGFKAGRDIGFGSGWSPAMGPIMGLLAPLVGIVMIAILQYLAIAEIKRYGIKIGSFSGLKKALVMEKIDELVAAERTPQPAYAMSNTP